MIRTRIAIALALCCVAAQAVAQQPRDGIVSTVTGTARIAGIVTSTDAVPKPLRRARVALSGSQLPAGRTAITNDEGRFAFDALPAGRYTIAAAKDGYVSLSFGAKRPGRPGSTVALRESERRDLTLRIPRGGVITGVIIGHDGQPASGIRVMALSDRYTGGSGERRLVPAGVSVSATDDRGVYRIFGLPAGDYVLSAQVPAGGFTQAQTQLISPAEVKRALDDLRQTSRGGRSGSSATVPAAGPAASEARRVFAYAPVFYPGTVAATEARRISLKPSEERTGIDFQLVHAPTATVEGTVVLGEGQSASVTLVSDNLLMPTVGPTRSARIGPDGHFSLSGVTPGRYTLIARTTVASQSRAPVMPLPTYWATTDIVVDGEDIAGIVLSPQQGLTIAGRIAFEGTAAPALPTGRLPLPITPSSPIPMYPIVVQIDADGRFAIHGILPGPFRAGVGMALRGVRTPIGRWWVKSLVVDGRDILDAPLEFRQSIADAALTLSDKASELSGRVIDAQGEPAANHVLVVFAADRTTWFHNSRRVAGVRPDAEGQYSVRNLPVGEYFVLADDDLEEGEWFDPSILEKLRARASRIVIGEYERKVHDVKVSVR